MPLNSVSRLKACGLLPADKVVYLACLLNSDSTQSGLYETSIGDLAYMTELTQSDVTAALKKLEEAELLVYDRGLIYVPQMCQNYNWSVFPYRMNTISTILRRHGNSPSRAFRRWAEDNPVDQEDLPLPSKRTGRTKGRTPGRTTTSEVYDDPFADFEDVPEEDTDTNDGRRAGHTIPHADPVQTPSTSYADPVQTPSASYVAPSIQDSTRIDSPYNTHPIALEGEGDYGSGKKEGRAENRLEGGAGGTNGARTTPAIDFSASLPLGAS